LGNKRRANFSFAQSSFFSANFANDSTNQTCSNRDFSLLDEFSFNIFMVSWAPFLFAFDNFGLGNASPVSNTYMKHDSVPLQNVSKEHGSRKPESGHLSFLFLLQVWQA